MTKDELWAAYVAKNPQFANDEGTVTLSPAGLRKLFSQTWEYGHDAGFANGKAFAEMQAERAPRGNAVDDLLNAWRKK